MNCFRAWEDTAIFSSDFIIKLQNIFLGFSKEKQTLDTQSTPGKSFSEDIDGIPIDLDLDGEEMPKSVVEDVHFSTKFKPSKWETVDPELVESQAITSKWENLDKGTAIFADDDIDGKPMEDTDYFESLVNTRSTTTAEYSQSTHSPALSREVLREIELKVVKYQDDLDSGRVRRTDNQPLAQMVEKYRAELVRKASVTSDLPKAAGSSSTLSRSKSRSRSPKSRYSHHHSKRYPSPSRRSRSRSPTKRKK